MANFWNLVNKVIDRADVLLLLLDARMVEGTRNLEIEDKVRQNNKPLIYVITKSDLADKDETEKYKKVLKPCVFVSSILHHGTTLLRERILIEAAKAKIPYDTIKVGILGYPNVGKSTLINALAGRKAAPTSCMSGYTTGLQNVRADSRIMLIDTPGVIPYKEKDLAKHAAIGTKDYTKIKDPEVAVIDMMKEFPGKIEKHFGVKIKDDMQETLEDIAIKKRLVLKGNEPDIERMCRTILKEWQQGKIK